MSAPGIFRPPTPANEPVKAYAPGSPEREELRTRLRELENDRVEIPLVIGGEEVRTGNTFEAVEPDDSDHVLPGIHSGGAEHADRPIAAAAGAWEDWSRTP